MNVTIRTTVPLPAWCFLFLFSINAAIAVDPLDRWHWRHPLPQGTPLRNVVHLQGEFLTFGDLGVLLASADGTNWVTRESGTIEQLHDCAYGSDVYVMVGDFGTILTSTNAMDWTPRFAATFFPLRGVAFGNGMFVVVGDGGTILTSADGSNWTPRAGGSWDFHTVTFAENLFVVGGEFSIVTSTDGANWTRRAWLDHVVSDVAHGDGAFVATSVRASGAVYSEPTALRSEDGITWTPSTVTAFFLFPRFSVVFGAGRWVVVGGADDPPGVYGQIHSSTNGLDWVTVHTNDYTLRGVAYSDGLFLACAHSGELLSSSDGLTWTNHGGAAHGPGYGLADMVWANGTFVGVVADYVAFSSDGRTWTNWHQVTNLPAYNDLHCVAYGAGRYVAGGTYRTVWTSVDGLNWTNPAPELSTEPYSRDVEGVAYGNGMFVGVASPYGDVLTSLDGLAWSATELLTNGDYQYWTGVAHGDPGFVVVGQNGGTAFSPDGINWTLPPPDPQTAAYAIAFGAGRYVAVGNERIAWTVDGTNWTRVNMGGLGTLHDVCYGPEGFVAVGFPNSNQPWMESPVWTSPDGVNWVRRHLRTARDFGSVAYGNGAYVISGGGDAFIQSDPVIRLALTAGNGTELTVTGPANFGCTIETLLAVQSGGWLPWINITLNGAGSVSLPIDPAANGASRFYRAVAAP